MKRNKLDEWYAAMKRVWARHSHEWFRGRFYIDVSDQASCCKYYGPAPDALPYFLLNRSGRSRSAIRNHLLTIKHFVRWCTERPTDVVLARFPEVKELLAEYVLTKEDDRTTLLRVGTDGTGAAVIRSVEARKF